SSLIVTNGMLMVQPVAGQTGGAQITVTVNDTGISASTTFLVRINSGTVAPSITGFSSQKDGFHLVVTGAPNTSYAIQASTDLVHWTVLGVATQTGPGSYLFVDTNSYLYLRRFYRVVQVTNAPPPSIGSESLQKDGFHLVVTGAPNTIYAIAASTNIVNWMVIGVATQTGPGSYLFVDTNS